MQPGKFNPKEFSTYTAANKIPYNLLWNLTDTCNLRCKHCFLPKGATNVSLEMAKEIIDFIKREGIFEVTLTGGECLLHPHFEEIYKALKQVGVFITIFTNATNFTPKLQQLFRKYRPHAVEISIYGHDEASYYENTGSKTAFHEFMEGLEYLHREKLPVTIKTPITQSNYPYLDRYVEIAKKYGFRYKFGTILFPMLDGNKKPLQERVEPQKIVELEFGDSEALKAFCEIVNSQSFERDCFENRCSSCGNHYIIRADHSFVICNRMEQPKFEFDSGDTLQQAFRQVQAYKTKLIEMFESSACGKCMLYNFCPGCPANLLQENDSLECNSYLREVTYNKLQYLKEKNLIDECIWEGVKEG